MFGLGLAVAVLLDATVIRMLVVPASTRGHQLLDRFITQKKHMAAVVDEYGTFVGVVTLEDVLVESADSLENQTTRQLKLAVRFLEPLMLLVMAAITLVVVVALLLPIFRMSSAL